MKLIIEIIEREDWITATVEIDNGDLLATDTSPVVEGATFDSRAAVVRSAVEMALAEMTSDR